MYDILLVNQLGRLMRMSYPVQVDPLTIIHQLCLQVNSKVQITVDDVAERLFSGRGLCKGDLSCVYGIQSIGNILLDVVVDEGRREIDVGDYVSRYGFEAATRAFQTARDLTLKFVALKGMRGCVEL